MTVNAAPLVPHDSRNPSLTATGAGPTAIVDLPWIPVFLTICFLIHPWLGLAATAGGIILFTMTLLTERASRARCESLSTSLPSSTAETS